MLCGSHGVRRPHRSTGQASGRSGRRCARACLVLLALLAGPAAFGQGFTLPDNRWELLVLPVDPQGRTIDELFGTALPREDHNVTWAMFGYNNGTGAYNLVGPDSRLQPGDAFWVTQRTGSPVELELPADLAPPEGTGSAVCATDSCYPRPLTQQQKPGSTASYSFNLVGSPAGGDTIVDDLRFTAEAPGNACVNGCTLDEADAAGNLASVFFRWDSSAGQYVGVRSGDTLSAWQGFWLGTVAASDSGQQLAHFPVGAVESDPCDGPTSPGDGCPRTGLPDLSQYDQVFGDEFSGATLDGSRWNTGLLWGPYVVINQEEQLYVDTLGMHANPAYDPFTLTGSSLQITATPVGADVPVPPRPPEDDPVWGSILEYRYNGPDANGPGYEEDKVNYLSGIITSNESFRMTHGYAEARLKLPGGRGLWPAFWLLNSHYVQDSPEIDIMEFLGQDRDRLYHTYHYFDVSDNWRKISTPSFPSLNADWTADWHTFGLEWAPREIIWYVDGQEVRRIDDSEYRIANQAMYLLANLAVGGTWPGAPDETTPFPATYEIDYIRAYEKKSSDTLDLAADYQLMFGDEFDGSTLDASRWTTHHPWGPWFPINEEQQYYIDVNGVDAGYADSPFSLADGVLTISADVAEPLPALPPADAPPPDAAVWTENRSFRQPQDYQRAPYTSGLLTSFDAFKFAEGYVEMRARIPEGAGIRPVFKLFHGYFVARLPEINIMEAAGVDTTTVLHSYIRSDGTAQKVRDTFRTEAAEGRFSDDFHTYGLRWQPGRLTWYVDRQPVHELVDDSVPYQLMYVVASLSVGDNLDPGADLDSVSFPVEYDIDYLRVYQQK